MQCIFLFTYLMDEEKFLVLSHLLSTKDCGFRHVLLDPNGLNELGYTYESRQVHRRSLLGYRVGRFFEKLVNGRKGLVKQAFLHGWLRVDINFPGPPLQAQQQR